MRQLQPESENVRTISRRRAILSMLFATTLTLAGCGGGGGGGSAPSSVVTGTLHDSAQADLAIGGATITMGGKTTTTTTTAQANATNNVGTFTLDNVPVGTFTATVKLPDGTTQILGFTPPVSSGTNASIDLFVNIGQVAGTVLLPGGAAAANAFVSIAATGDVVQADTNGNFIFVDIPQGATTISAVLGTASVTQSITVANGLLTVGNVQLVDNPDPNPPGLPATVTGTVKTPTGVGAGATVILFRNGTQLEQMSAAADGTFGFYVPVGSYSVTVLLSGYQNGSASGTLTNPNNPITINVTLVSN